MLNFNNKKIAVYILASLLLICALPYFVGVKPTASPSYVFGYRNQAGIVLFVALAALATQFSGWFGAAFSQGADARPVPIASLWSALAIVAACCGLMLALAANFGGFGESNYEIDRIHLLAQGRVPYVDFEWPFGLSSLYVPLALSRILDCSVVVGYHIFWVFNCLAGTICVYLTVNVVDYPSDRRRTIFYLLLFGYLGSILTMGTHYAFLRHAFPLLAVVMVAAVLGRPGPGNRRGAALLALASTCIALLISPETAIGVAFSAAGLLCLSARAAHTGWVRFSAVCAALLILFAAAFKFGLLNTLLASGGGADSFPIAPSLHIAFLYFSTLIGAFYLRTKLSAEALPDGIVALLLYSVPMIVPALSRCDPGHVFLNGQGMTIACLFLLSSTRVRWRYYALAYSLIFIVLTNASGLWMYRFLLGRAMLSTVERTDIGQRAVLAYAAAHPSAMASRIALEMTRNRAPEPSLSDIYPHWQGNFLAPFGYNRSLGTTWDPRIDFGFYEGLENANTPAAVARKVDELRQAPERALLIPKAYLGSCDVAALADRATISILFMTPYFNPVRNPENIHRALCDHIVSDYVQVVEPGPDNFNVGLWVRKEQVANLH